MSNENRAAKEHTAPFINVTPLIDVLLVLLIIFMVISPTRPSRFTAKLPENAPPSQQAEVESLVVTVDYGGGYQLNSTPAATLDDLQTLLTGALNGRPDDRKAVFIKAPRALGYGEVVKVIDVMKAAGSAPIGLQIDQLEQ